MSDRETSAHPPMASLEGRHDATLWSPGLRLMQHRGPRAKGLLLLLLSWLAALLLSMLALKGVGPAVPVGLSNDGLVPLRSIAESAWPFMYQVSPGVAGLALLAVLYLAVCAWMSLGALTQTSPPLAAEPAASPEFAQLHKPEEEKPVAIPAQLHSARDLSDAHLALQLSSQQINSAIGETARRTISLCGAFDSCGKHVDMASAELDAVQDEATHTQQIMASLREHLLTLGGHCQALGGTAQRMAGSAVPVAAAQHVDQLLEVLHAQILHCHQLSERVGGAERSNQRRVDAIRRSVEGLGHLADLGLREGHQVMVLTRQIEASLAEGSQWLEELGAACAAPRS
jgi:hypothetical protein